MITNRMALDRCEMKKENLHIIFEKAAKGDVESMKLANEIRKLLNMKIK